MKRFPLLLIVAWLLYGPLAFASGVSIRDTAGFIPPMDARQLQGESWPFEVHILVENASSFDALEDDAHRAVTSPNVVVLAVDAAHHKVVTRFGSSTGIKPGDYDSISQAGNAHFRAHEIAQGFDAMLFRAKASRDAVVAISASTTPVVVEGGLSSGTWLGIGLLVTLFAGLAIWLYRRRERAELTGQLAAALHRVRTLEQLERNRERAPGSEMGAELVEKGRRIASLEQELKRAREKGDAVTRKFAEEFQAREKAEMDLLKAQRAGNDLQTKLRMSETTVAKLTELGAEAERWKNRADKAETELGKLRAVVGTPPMPPMAKGWGIMRRLGRQGMT